MPVGDLFQGAEHRAQEGHGHLLQHGLSRHVPGDGNRVNRRMQKSVMELRLNERVKSLFAKDGNSGILHLTIFAIGNQAV